MESATILSAGAIVCFSVYYEMIGVSYLPHVTWEGIKVRDVLLG